MPAATLPVGTPLWRPPVNLAASQSDRNTSTMPWHPEQTDSTCRHFVGVTIRDGEWVSHAIPVAKNGVQLVRVMGPVSFGQAVGLVPGENYVSAFTSEPCGLSQASIGGSEVKLIPVKLGAPAGSGPQYLKAKIKKEGPDALLCILNDESEVVVSKPPHLAVTPRIRMSIPSRGTFTQIPGPIPAAPVSAQEIGIGADPKIFYIDDAFVEPINNGLAMFRATPDDWMYGYIASREWGGGHLITLRPFEISGSGIYDSYELITASHVGYDATFLRNNSMSELWWRMAVPIPFIESQTNWFRDGFIMDKSRFMEEGLAEFPSGLLGIGGVNLSQFGIIPRIQSIRRQTVFPSYLHTGMVNYGESSKPQEISSFAELGVASADESEDYPLKEIVVMKVPDGAYGPFSSDHLAIGGAEYTPYIDPNFDKRYWADLCDIKMTPKIRPVSQFYADSWPNSVIGKVFHE